MLEESLKSALIPQQDRIWKNAHICHKPRLLLVLAALESLCVGNHKQEVKAKVALADL